MNHILRLEAGDRCVDGCNQQVEGAGGQRTRFAFHQYVFNIARIARIGTGVDHGPFVGPIQLDDLHGDARAIDTIERGQAHDDLHG